MTQARNRRQEHKLNPCYNPDLTKSLKRSTSAPLRTSNLKADDSKSNHGGSLLSRRL